MAEQGSSQSSGDITPNDRLMAALSYPIPILAVVILLVQEMKARAFQKYHAIQALAFAIVLGVALGIVRAILGLLKVGACGGFLSFLWLSTLYWAYLAYQGQYFEIPVLTQFLKRQKLL